MGTRYIHNLKQVKIRIQGKPGQVMWGNLQSPVESKPVQNLANFSLKDAERHTKLLSKIEKYKEDKILQELQLIENEKMKTAKLLKLKKLREQKRKEYLGNSNLLSFR